MLPRITPSRSLPQVPCFLLLFLFSLLPPIPMFLSNACGLTSSHQILMDRALKHSHIVLLKKIVVNLRRCGHDFARLVLKQLGTTHILNVSRGLASCRESARLAGATGEQVHDFLYKTRHLLLY